ncbi:MAG TPA: hypothetical protein VE888_04690, partial [Streptosporangiaceae bacterium]|nr:hypothetical protein [Streptosporangiaceae bacterium]
MSANRTVMHLVTAQSVAGAELVNPGLGFGYPVEPVAEQGALGSGERREVGERSAQVHGRGR